MAKRKTRQGVRKGVSSARKQRAPAKPMQILPQLFIAGVILRLLLSLLLKRNPSITPDEALYTNIAKSLLSEGEILFRGQPAKYAYLLYPLLLSPLYALLPAGTDYFVVAQLLNACLICSVVFPAYYAAREITGRHDRALTVATLSLLLPDMVMTSFVMSECLVYALYTACFYAIVLAVKRGKARYYLLVGVLGALMYYTKNFHALLSAVFLLLTLVVHLADKEYRKALFALGSGGVMAALCAAFMALSTKGFGLVAPTYNINTAGDVLGGIGEMLANPAPYAEGFVMYAVFFTVALGGVFFVIPAFSLRTFSRDNRLIALTVGGALTAVLFTVLYVIHPLTRSGAFNARVELRYLSLYFIPLITLSLASEVDGKRLNVFGVAWLGLAAVYAVVPGLGSGFAKASANIDNHALAFLSPTLVGDVACRALSILMAALLALSAYFLCAKGWTRRMQYAAFAGIIALFLFSNVAAYSVNTSRNSPEVRDDALQAARAIDAADGEAVFVTWLSYSAENLAVDLRAKTMLGNTDCGDLIDQLRQTDGVYQPFIPAKTSLTYPDRPLADASLLVFDSGCAFYFQPMPGARTEGTRHGLYSLLYLDKGQRAFASVLDGLNSDDTLPIGDDRAEITVFDPATRDESGQIVLSLRLSSPKDGVVVRLDAGHGEATTLLNKGVHTVRVAVNAGERFPQSILLHADAPGVKLYGCEARYE